MYTKNTSDAWHIPQYPTRKHCITRIYTPIYCYQPMSYQLNNSESRSSIWTCHWQLSVYRQFRCNKGSCVNHEWRNVKGNRGCGLELVRVFWEGKEAERNECTDLFYIFLKGPVF